MAVTVTAVEAPSTGSPVDEFLSLARKRFRTSANAEYETRLLMMQDYEFRYSDQWDAADRANRREDGRPCLTINRIPQFIRQVTNQQRATRPAIQVNPVDSDADPKAAEAIQGVVRNIENNSDADIVYSTACDHQTTIGRGWLRALTEYADDDAFDQVITLKPVPDPFSVYPDPAHTRIDGADMRYLFNIESVPDDEVKRRWGADALANYQYWLEANQGESADWAPEGRKVVAEYFYKEIKTETLVEIRYPKLADDGETIIYDTIKIPKAQADDIEWPEGWSILNEREVDRIVVKWAIITPAEVLEGNENKTAGRVFPSKFIPFVPVLGDRMVLNGKVILSGMVRDAKDPQRMMNHWASSITETIGIAPRAPYIGIEGQFKGHEAKWNQAHKKNFAYLEVNPVSVAGHPAPFPQRQQFEPAIAAMIQAYMLTDNDMKAVMGLYDASLGKTGPEQSGKAILARQRQGEVGNSNYLDNLGRAIRHTGRILLDMMPRVYSPARIARILGADNEETKVILYSGEENKGDAEALGVKLGIERIYDLSVGRYDITISTGPSYQSRRQEAVDALIQLAQANPELVPIIGDLMVSNMDWPGAAEVAARLARMVPAQALSAEEQQKRAEAGQLQLPSQVQQQMQEMGEKLNELEQVNAELKAGADVKQRELALKAQIAKMELNFKRQLAALQHEAELAKIRAEAQAEQVEMQVQARLDEILGRQEIQGKLQLAKQKLDNDREIAEIKAKNTKEVAGITARAQAQAAKTKAAAKPKPRSKAPAK